MLVYLTYPLHALWPMRLQCTFSSALSLATCLALFHDFHHSSRFYSFLSGCFCWVSHCRLSYRCPCYSHQSTVHCTTGVPCYSHQSTVHCTTGVPCYSHQSTVHCTTGVPCYSHQPTVHCPTDLTRFAIQAKGPDGKWTRKPLAYRESNNFHLLITRPPEICVNLVFKHIHAASSYTICRQFVPLIYCPL